MASVPFFRPLASFAIAYPGITWCGSLETFSTHRGIHNYFNELIQSQRSTRPGLDGDSPNEPSPSLALTKWKGCTSPPNPKRNSRILCEWLLNPEPSASGRPAQPRGLSSREEGDHREWQPVVCRRTRSPKPFRPLRALALALHATSKFVSAGAMVLYSS
ncbi:MAG: hypothetical protein JWM16_408 [Verrucomicrobiales bacterium]|nr:hypothetical protein [Verrucomicrobiales bacterium]